MNLSRSFGLKLLIICSLLYLSSLLIISSFFTQNKCHSIDCRNSSNVLNEDNIRITFILIEFEFFENDLTETLVSICDSSPNYRVLVISQKPIYPPIGSKDIKIRCDVRFIDNSFSLNKSLIESQIESHINGEYVVIIPDSIRIGSKREMFDLIRDLDQMNSVNKTALIVPIVSTFNVSDNCIEIDFDIKRWSLRYRQLDSFDSCDALEGNDYAILVTKTNLLELNRPFVRPFIESFFIQSKINKIKVKLLDNYLLFRKGKQLFEQNERNKWKHQLWSEQRRKSLFDTIGVKKLIDSDLSVHWFGCSKHTNRCFPTVINEMPDYLFINRWTPVCCLKNLAETGRHVFEILESHSVRYWLEGGSLLGAARNGQIIPWDYDIDIGIYEEDIPKCQYFPDKSPKVDEKGFVWEKASEGDFYRVQFSQTNRLHVDIFPFYSRNGTMTKNTWFESHIQDREFPEHFLKPLTRIGFIEWNAFAPNNVQQFLEYKFGKNVIQNPEYPKPELLKFPTKQTIY